MAGKVTVDMGEAVKKMKAAKTGKEIVESWEALVPSGTETLSANKEVFGVYIEKAPNILKYFCQDPLVYSMEKGALDPKTRELVVIGVIAALQNGGGLTMHIPAAMGQGATEEEIIDVIHLACYEFGKVGCSTIGPGMAEGFRQASLAQAKT